MTLSRKTAVRLVSGALGLGALVAVGWYTYEAFNSGLRLSELSLDWLAAALVLHVLVISALPVMWIRLLGLVKTDSDIQPRLGDRGLIHAYSRSWLARYIPGRVWMFGGRILYGRSAGISTKSITASTTLEAGISYSALGLLGVAMILGTWTHWTLAIVVSVGAFSTLLILVRSLFRVTASTESDNRTVRWLVKGSLLLRGNSVPSDKALFSILLIYWLHAGMQLVFFVLVALAVQPFAPGDYLLLAGAWGIGASIGYISVFSAGGLGVRDGVALAFVGPAFTGPVAAAVVAASRIVLVLADLALVSTVEIAVLLLRRRELRHSPGITNRDNRSIEPSRTY